MERPGRERELVQRAGAGKHLVAVCRIQHGIRPLRQRLLDVDAAVWLYLGIGLLLGLSALPMRRLELLRQLWMGLGAGDERLHALVGQWLLRPQYRHWLWRLSSPVPPASAASAAHRPWTPP